MIGVLVLIVFSVVWFLPLLRKHEKSVTEPRKYYILAFLAGVVCTLLGMALQIGSSMLYQQVLKLAMFESRVLRIIAGFLNVMISIAVVEELVKSFFGRLIVKRIPNLSEAGCMLLMGMVGIGFGFVEELGGSDLMSGILNGVLELHLFFQFVMGAFMWRAWDAKKKGDKAGSRKNMTLALLIPILVHGVYDYFLLLGQNIVDTNLEQAFLFMVIALVIGIIYVIKSVRFAHRTVNKELKQNTVAN